MVFNSTFKTKTILVLPGSFIPKELGHTSHPPPRCVAWDSHLSLGGPPKSALQVPLVSGQRQVFGLLLPQSCVCFPTAMPGTPIESIWQHRGGRRASKALTVFMVPAASLASNEVSSSFVWGFLGAHAHFFKVVKG